MSNVHLPRKLRELSAAGAKGVRRDEWRQSQTTVPMMLAEGLAVVEVRVEPVEYLVITDKGRRALRGEL
jgi:hypothetical protein